jgi:serine/threonine protein phosphatase PrpC
MSGRDWTVLAASVRGAAHVRVGKPNQDAVDWWKGEDGTVVLAVADGHGSEACFRSDRGARFAVEAAIGACADLAGRLAPMAIRDGMARGHLGGELAREIVRRWQRRVEEDRAGEDGDGVEATNRRRPGPAGSTRAYGSTLIAALAVEAELVLLLQCGDGDVLAVAADGTVYRPVPADERSFGNETASLCLPEAWTEFRFRLLDADELPTLLMLATDGYANSYAGDEAFREVAHDLSRAVDADGAEVVAAALPRWLEETSAGGSGDDITAGLLARRTG